MAVPGGLAAGAFMKLVAHKPPTKELVDELITKVQRCAHCGALCWRSDGAFTSSLSLIYNTDYDK